MKTKALYSIITLAAVLANPALHSPSYADEPVEVAKLEPTCAAPYLISADKKSCSFDKSKFSDSKTCTDSGFTFANNECTTNKIAPSPTCDKVIEGIYVKDGKCVVEKGAPTSATSDYVGDYFRIVAVSNPNRISYPYGTVFKVMSQRPVGDNDRLLTVAEVPAEQWNILVVAGWANPMHGAVEQQVLASDLIDNGASRIGWTYGLLALPYKYHLHDHSFGTEISAGPYVGRRFGRAGSSTTVALMAGIGSVKGEVRNAAGSITETPNLQAFTVAAGLMWDISKAVNIKPFKIGLFAGQDRVSKSDLVKYPNNGRTWLSFQIGYDFTDK